MNKKKVLFILTLIILLSFSVSVYAKTDYIKAQAPCYTNEATGYKVYIDDYADYLSPDEEVMLIEDMKPITEYGNVAFLSYTDSTKGALGRIGSDTLSYYLNNQGSFDSGVVFSVNPSDIYIYSEGAMYKIIDKKYAYTITDNIYKEAKDDNMYNCSVHCYSLIKKVLEGQRIAQPMKYTCNILLGLMFSILFSFVYVHRKSLVSQTGAEELIANAKKSFKNGETKAELINSYKTYTPQSSSSGYRSGGSHGGFHGGGGHGGGHFGGGGGHHR